MNKFVGSVAALILVMLASSTSASAQTPPGTVFRDCADCPEMVVMPRGSFTMGSPSNEQTRTNDEGPQHTVSINYDLAVGLYEVTRGEFGQFISATGHQTLGGCSVLIWPSGSQNDESASWHSPGFSQDANQPVVCVNWRDAQAYVRWLSRRTGKSYRLLSESEWEYAARGGSQSAFPNGSAWWACEIGNIRDQSYRRQSQSSAANWMRCDDGYFLTSPGGTYQANAFGLHDLHGNVAEWTQDCWSESYNGAPNNGSARESGDCSRRVIRGGSWAHQAIRARNAFRHRTYAETRYSATGFRVARGTE